MDVGMASVAKRDDVFPAIQPAVLKLNNMMPSGWLSFADKTYSVSPNPHFMQFCLS